MLRFNLLAVIIGGILLIYFVRKRKYVFKSLYETMKINPIVRNRIFKYILNILSKIFFKKQFYLAEKEEGIYKVCGILLVAVLGMYGCDKGYSEETPKNSYELLVFQYVDAMSRMTEALQEVRDQRSADRVSETIGIHSMKVKELSLKISNLEAFYKNNHRGVYDKMQDKILKASSKLFEQIIRISGEPYGEEDYKKSEVF